MSKRRFLAKHALYIGNISGPKVCSIFIAERARSSFRLSKMAGIISSSGADILLVQNCSRDWTMSPSLSARLINSVMIRDCTHGAYVMQAHLARSCNLAA